jgi:hypothetical protein
MRFDSLIHLAKISRALAKDRRIVVLGSSSLLGCFPELGEPGQPLETSLDADLLVDGIDEGMAAVFKEAIGAESLFERQVGCHADVLRSAIQDVFPVGWEERLVPLADCDGVFCLEPHDMAAAKLQAGRPKDVALIAALLKTNRLNLQTIEARLLTTKMQEKMILFAHERLAEAVAIAGAN